MTFTWPDDMPSTAFWGRCSGQVEGICVHLAGKISKICLGSTCGGRCPGQVNVTGIANTEIRKDALPDASSCTNCGQSIKIAKFAECLR